VVSGEGRAGNTAEALPAGGALRSRLARPAGDGPASPAGDKGENTPSSSSVPYSGKAICD